MEEDLWNRFREACNKKFGDKQGKIKQGYVLALTEFSNSVLDVVEDSTSTPEPPTLLAKKLEQVTVVKPVPPQPQTKSVAQELIEHEAEASIELDQVQESIEAKAKKLAEERRKAEESDHKVLT